MHPAKEQKKPTQLLNNLEYTTGIVEMNYWLKSFKKQIKIGIIEII